MKVFLSIAKIIAMFLFCVFASGCASMPSMLTAHATFGYNTAIHKDLISLPPPAQKIIVAVYSFKDQTGQYKYSSQVSSFSTAVTQGATSMLIKALDDSGWFVPIEREGLSDLLNERKIIRSTQENVANIKKGDKTNPPEVLPPLLYAPVILEGGIIAYETNVVTGGFGAKYFGLGGSVESRRDQVTIYLRATAVKNGKILKSVSTTKTILSREVDFGVYRFVRTKRLLEAEAGFSTNEPPQMCVLEAIEKAVYDLVVEGINDKIWNLENPDDINSPSIQNYFKEKKEVEKIVRFDRKGNIKSVTEKK